MKSKKTISLIFAFICLIGLLVGGLFIFKKYKDKLNNNVNNVTTITSVNDDLYNVSDTAGFISNNWGLMNNQNFVNKNNYVFDLNKAVQDTAITANVNNQNWFARNSISDHSLIGMDIGSEQSFIRVGHLNSLNFKMLTDKDYKLLDLWKNNNPNFKYTKSLLHAYFVARIIDFFDLDLIGLTEIEKTVVADNSKQNPVSNFVNLLNSFNSSNTKKYNYILSDVLAGKTSSPGQHEKVCVIYNENTIKVVDKKVYSNNLYELNNNQWQLVSQQPEVINKLKYYDYVRPPFGVYIESNKIPTKLSVIFSHNDSPGASGTTVKEEYLYQTQGSKEIFESYHLNDVLNEFNSFKSEFLPIYMGDTNIKTNNQALLFKSIESSKYSFAFEDNKYFNSSLTTTITANEVSTEINKLNSVIKNKLDFNANKLEYKKQLTRLQSNAYDKIIYNKSIPVIKTNLSKTSVSILNKSDLSKQYIDFYYSKNFEQVVGFINMKDYINDKKYFLL